MGQAGPHGSCRKRVQSYIVMIQEILNGQAEEIKRSEVQVYETIPDATRQFFEAMFLPDDLICFRFVESYTNEDGKKDQEIYGNQYLTLQEFISLNWWGPLCEQSKEQRANLYFGVCPRPRKPRHKKETYDKSIHVQTVRVLWCDVDGCQPEETLARIDAAALPPPSFVVGTGNGTHVYWILDRPYIIADAFKLPALKEWVVNKWKYHYIDPDTKEKKRLPKVSPTGNVIQTILDGIARKVGGGDVKTKDLARILRVPGSLNRKDERNGKEPIPCFVYSAHPERVYPLEVFQDDVKEDPNDDGTQADVKGDGTQGDGTQDHKADVKDDSPDGGEKAGPVLTPEQLARLDELGRASEEPPSPEWDDTTQSKFLSALLTSKDLLAAAVPILKARYFSTEAHVLTCKTLLEFFNQYKDVPEPFMMTKLLAGQLGDRDQTVQDSFRTALDELYSVYAPRSPATGLALLDDLKVFAENQEFKTLGHQVYEALKTDPRKIGEQRTVMMAGCREMNKRAGQDQDGPMTAKELLELLDPEWLVERHFPRNIIGLVYGNYGSLKSFYCLELALSVATGRKFLNTFPVEKGQVVYLVGEGRDGYKKRVAAWMKHSEITEPPGNFWLWSESFNFTDPNDCERFLCGLEMKGIRPALVIVDTLSTFMPGREDEENISLYNGSMRTIRDELGGACVLTVAHSGKDESRGIRGSSKAPCDADITVFMKLDKHECPHVEFQKCKDTEKPTGYTLMKVPVPLGKDRKGRDVNSLVLTYDPATATAPAPDIGAEKRKQLEVDKAAVFDILPRLRPGTATAKNALDRNGIGKKLGWFDPAGEVDRNKVRHVMDAFEAEQGGPVRWERFSTKRNSPYYYWAEVPDTAADKESEQ